MGGERNRNVLAWLQAGGPAPSQLAVGGLPRRAPRPGRGAAPGHPGRGPVARPSHLAHRWLGVLDARHGRAPRALRPAGRAGVGLLIDVEASPLRTHEMSRAGTIRATLGAGDVLVGDRGFCSFAHLAMLAQGGIHAVFRMHQRQTVDFTPGRPRAAGPRGPRKAGRDRAGCDAWASSIRWSSGSSRRPAPPG